MSEHQLRNTQATQNATAGQISIHDLVGMYIGLASVLNPTEKLTQIKSNFENIILLFSTSLGNPQ